MKSAKFLRTLILKKIWERLLLEIVIGSLLERTTVFVSMKRPKKLFFKLFLPKGFCNSFQNNLCIDRIKISEEVFQICSEKKKKKKRRKHFFKIQKKPRKTSLTNFQESCKLLTEACNCIKKETLVQTFSWEFCEIFKNTNSIENLWTTDLSGLIEKEPNRQLHVQS